MAPEKYFWKNKKIQIVYEGSKFLKMGKSDFWGILKRFCEFYRFYWLILNSNAVMNDQHRIIFITEIKSLILFSKYQNLIKKGYTMGPQLRK